MEKRETLDLRDNHVVKRGIDGMTAAELNVKLKRGYGDIELGNTRPANEVFAKFREGKTNSVKNGNHI